MGSVLLVVVEGFLPAPVVEYVVWHDGWYPCAVIELDTLCRWLRVRGDLLRPCLQHVGGGSVVGCAVASSV